MRIPIADAPYYGNGVSARLFELGLCLSSGSGMNEVDLERVVRILLEKLMD